MFVSNNNRIGLTSVLLSSAIATTFFASPVNALGRSLPNIPKHTTEFTNTAPKLIDSSATSQSPGARSTYYFTIKVPETAINSVKAVTITQKPALETIKFALDRSQASVDNEQAGALPVQLTSIGGVQNNENNEVTVVFDEAIQPGNTVTVGLKALSNPDIGGIYSFGVTVFPEDQTSDGLYLGNARFHFNRH